MTVVQKHAEWENDPWWKRSAYPIASGPDAPTPRILRMAASAPGGVIRWWEAEEQYLLGSANARRARRLGSRSYCMGVKRILGRHFVKVEGTNGFYVLKSTIKGED